MTRDEPSARRALRAGSLNARATDVRLGVIPVLDSRGGGVYQYSLLVLEALTAHRPTASKVLVVADPADPIVRHYVRHGWDVRALPNAPLWRRLRGRARALLGPTMADRVVSLEGAIRSRPERRHANAEALPTSPPRVRLADLELDVLIELGHGGLAFDQGIPFIVPVHDIQHRLQPEFPEVGAPDEWKRRERLLRRICSEARVILVDSEVGRDDVLRFYSDLIDDDRIRILPFVPSPYLKPAAPERVDAVKRLRGLPDRYLLMPAQFWQHKNHRRVVEAMAVPAVRGLGIHVVMTGGALDALRQETLSEIRDAIEAHDLGERIHLVGQVPDEEMAALYGGATGVVLPTFFGPTNIPVVEAWALGVPVLTSDIRGIREQCGDAALLVDPRSVDAIALGMVALWSDSELRTRLVAAGSARHSSWSTAQFNSTLGRILDEVTAVAASA